MGRGLSGVVAALALLAGFHASAQTFSATFSNARGNDWWIETDVTANQALAGVDARIDAGAWLTLTRTSWGSWARSSFVEDNHLVQFRARNATGAEVLSVRYSWPSATPIDTTPPVGGGAGGGGSATGGGGGATGGGGGATGGGGGSATGGGGGSTTGGGGGSAGGGTGGASSFVATFNNPRGNDWWVECEVSSSQSIASVHARANGGAWNALQATSWGSWASSFNVAFNAVVEFRATSTTGAVALSRGYLWPSATPVGGGGGSSGGGGGTGTGGGTAGGVGGGGGTATGGGTGGGGAVTGPDVLVTVRADRSPHGITTPVRIDRRFYGMNIANWRDQDYQPTIDPAFGAYLRALRPGVLRWPPGETSQDTVWQRGGPGQTGSYAITPSDIDAYIALCRHVGADPLFSINIKTGTPVAAADLVRFLNLERRYGVRYFQLGNEPDYVGPLNTPQRAIDQHLTYVQAMVAVDPTITFVGPELLTGAHVLGLNGQTNWMAPFLQSAGSTVSGISWHHYQLDSGQDNPNSSAYFTLENLFQETAPDWNPASIDFADQLMPALNSMRDQHAPGATVWITEFAEDPAELAGAGMSDRFAGALWAADVLGRFASWGPGAIVKWIFKEDDALSLITTNNQPRPEYYTYWLYARHFGDRLVDTVSNAKAAVNAHAAWRSDGALTLVLVNKTATARSVQLSFTGLNPASATRYVISGQSLTGTAVSLNGQTLTATNVDTDGIAPQAVPASQLLTVPAPALSIQLIIYRP